MLNNKLFLKGLSIIRAFPLGIMLAPGAGVVSFVARVKEKPEISVTSTDGNLNFPIFNFPDRGSQQVTNQVAAVDSRGRQSEWVERTIDVMYYQSPSIGAMTPIRTGERVVIKRNWSVSSIALDGPDSEKNTAKLSFFVRPQGGEWAENTGANATALSCKDSEAALDGTLPGNGYFEFKVRLEDKLALVEAGPFNIPTEGFPVSVSANNKVGINKLVDKNGAQVQIRGESNLLNLDGSANPHMSITKDGKGALDIGFLHDHATRNRYFVLQNYLDGGTWFRFDKDGISSMGRRFAFADLKDFGNDPLTLDQVPNGFNRLRDKGPRKDEHWSLSVTWLIESKVEGFQIAWMPMKNDAVLYRRIKRGGVWKPWKEF